MNPILLLVSVLVVLIGIVTTRLNGDRLTNLQENSGSSSQNIDKDQSIEQESEDIETPIPKLSNQTPEATPTNVPTPKQNEVPQANNTTNLNDYIYPKAVEKEKGQNSIKLISSDSPDTITDWYKEKIKEKGMNVTSFVVTKTNDNVLNKLAGASSQAKVEVEISRPSGTSQTQISVLVN